MTEWFEQWFGEAYLKLYPHRDDEDAAYAVALIADHVVFDGSTVLDLACGPGRHAVLLRDLGATVVGFDLSLPLLSRAKHRSTTPMLVVRGDMRRLPFAQETFDVVVNLFTSFGYFADDRQHELVLVDVATVLKRGGIFVFDFFNSTDLRESLIEHEERAIGGQRVAIDRRITEDGRFVVKEMHLVDDGRSFVERVRLFHEGELEDLMERAGLVVRSRFGDYDGSALRPNSPRILLIVERP